MLSRKRPTPMRSLPWILAAGTLALLVTSGEAQAPGGIAYRVVIPSDGVHTFYREEAGRRTLWVRVQFKVLRAGDGTVTTDVDRTEIVVKEDGQKVAELEVFQPRAQPLTSVLAIDTSGSMASSGKMDEARKAATTFLDRLHPKADTGLILFNHLLHTREAPVGDPAHIAEHRARLRNLIAGARPGGGTAYLDATAEALRMLKDIEGRRAVVVLTDGQDMNSKNSLEEVIRQAQIAEVPVYTLGIGEPGRNQPVTTVLALDRSGSMADKANNTDALTKMEALYKAASRFVDLVRPGARTTLLPFSSRVENPRPFGADKDALERQIRQLKPKGKTKLYDAAFAGIETLIAENPPGKKAVVILTDGKDTDSRRRIEQVIRRAKQAGVALHTLGFGRPGDVRPEELKRMARETGGTYHHADNPQRLYEIFEDLSIQLHDDGIDEAALRRLAEQTGGKYFHARDVSQLQFLYEQLAEELQSTYTVTFPSRRPVHDGTVRGIDISVWRGGQRISEGGQADLQVHGVLVPEMSVWVYLGFLSLLGALLVLPAGLRKFLRPA
jgi:VWFA-related protein